MLLNFTIDKTGGFMRRLIIVLLLFSSYIILYSQNYRYDLSQDDLNLLLGQFIHNDKIENRRWVENIFSWGNQIAIDSNDSLIEIDYDSRYTSLLLDEQYRNHLLLINDGITLIIKNIEKYSSNEFILTLSTAYYISSYYENWGIRDIGQVSFTFLDNRNVIIKNINRNNYYDLNAQWWKSAGPTIINE